MKPSNHARVRTRGHLSLDVGKWDGWTAGPGFPLPAWWDGIHVRDGSRGISVPRELSGCVNLEAMGKSALHPDRGRLGG